MDYLKGESVMAKKIRKTMTDNQFVKAMNELNERVPVKLRGGRTPIVIPNKKREAEKKACRGKVKE